MREFFGIGRRVGFVKFIVFSPTVKYDIMLSLVVFENLLLVVIVTLNAKACLSDSQWAQCLFRLCFLTGEASPVSLLWFLDFWQSEFMRLLVDIGTFEG